MPKRNYPKIKQFLDLRKSLLIFVPRGSGKTYYLTRLLEKYENFEVIDLLDSFQYKKYLLNPSLIYKEIEASISPDTTKYSMIDEIQRVPALLNEVHRCIEKFKPHIVFILTGSSARKLKRENANLLAGRALALDFFPISLDEIDFNSKLNKFLLLGTLPEVVTSDNSDYKKEYLTTYVSTYLEEEIKKRI